MMDNGLQIIFMYMLQYELLLCLKNLRHKHKIV